MINKKMLIGMVLIVLTLTPMLSAISIEIDMKDNFGVGDEISFNYSLLSEEAVDIQYTAYVTCPSALVPLLELIDASLEAGVSLEKSYVYMSSVSENIEPQTCEAVVGVSNGEEVIEKKSFDITTLPSIDFNILTCEDLNCSEQTRVFILNGDIYLDYESEVADLSTSGTLTYPKGNIENIDLPFSFSAEDIGTYELETRASGEGYKTTVKNIQFAVIEKEADIGYANLLLEGEDVEEEKDYLAYIVIGITMVLIVIVLFLLVKKRRKP